MQIVTIFIESKYVLLKEIPKNSDFVSLNLVVILDKKEEMYVIILHLYKLNTQI